MKPMESDALDRLYRTLGLAGGVQVSGTELDDGTLSMMLNANEIVRRSRTASPTTGWYMCILEHVHAAAGQLDEPIDPYAPGASAVAPFPANVPRGYDFWLLNVMLKRVAGAGTIDSAWIGVNGGPLQQGWGEDDGGAPVIANDTVAVALFTGLDTGTTSSLGIDAQGKVKIPIGMRIPRGATITSFSDVAGASATLRFYLQCGLFPEGLGQDVASF